MVSYIQVSFEGDGAGAGGLAWGQQQVWRAIVEVGASMSMGGAVPVTDGRTLEDIAAELRFLMSRYAALRSRLVFTEPWHATSVDACHLVRQEIAAEGTTALEVHDAGPDEDPAEIAGALFAAWKARDFDYAHEWPIREAVVRQDGAVTHVVVQISHLVADGSALGTMIRSLFSRESPYTAMQPLDLVAAQRSSSRTTDTAMRYWEAALRQLPPRRLPAAVDRGEPRWRQVVWRSTALLLASQRAAALLGTDTGSVLLAAYAVACNEVTGQRAPFATQVIVSNRFRPGLADVISPLAQNGLAVLDVAGLPPREVVDLARRAFLNASKHAYYDPAARLALFDRLGGVDLAVFYNDRRVGILEAQGPLAEVPAAADVEAARPLTALVSERPLPFFNEQLMVNVDDVVDTVQLTVEVDTHHLAMADLHRLLLAMEAFAVAAALDQAAAPDETAALDQAAALGQAGALGQAVAST
ncbi:condensation domain-containing protein [Dactylosporangium sp. NPDC050588]|uniref:condensation domain-containing protein n=1 Tax=Dactylosporangium sp. NPDC050588 TaxID=3157211 RepID=UPI0033F247B2